MKKILITAGILLLATQAWAAQITLDTTPYTGNSSNLRKLGVTSNSNFDENYAAIALNTAKTGITVQQATDIATNNGKVTYPGAELTADELAAVNGAALPSATNVMATMDDVTSVGGMSSLSDDPAPALGGNMTMGAFNIEGVTAAIMGFLTGVDEDIQAAIDNSMKLTGDQTVAGVKTFSSFPVTPGSAPTTDYQVANKQYVDAHSGADANAIHDNVADEISAITVKGTPASGDYLIIEDSEAAGVKKHILVGSLPTGGGGEANTASSDGTGVSVFNAKAGIDLGFNAIKSENALLTVALDGATHDVELTVDETAMTLSNIGGAVTDAQVPNDITITELSGTNTGDEVAATITVAGIAELAVSADVVTGAETDTIVTPDTLTDKMASPGEIGGTTPAVVNATAYKSPQTTDGAQFNIMYEDGTEAGANYIGWASPNASSNDLVLIMPNADPTAGQILACTMEGSQVTFSDGVARDAATCSWTTASGTGDLKADGTVPLTANWDVGAFAITGLTFTSDQATGTAPFIVASTTVVTNLNADTVDGESASAIVTSARVGTSSANLDNTDASIEWEDAADLDSDGSITDGAVDSVHLNSITLSPIILAEPDQLQPIDDAWPLYQFLAETYPSGVTIDSIHISTSATCTDALSFEEWSNNGTAWSTDSTVEAITLSGTHTEDDGTLADASLAADAWLYIDLPATPTDIAYYSVVISFHAN